MVRFAALVCLVCLSSCAAPQEAPPVTSETPSPTPESRASEDAAPALDWAIAIHGGAGVRRSQVGPEEEPAYLESLTRALDLGRSMLAEGARGVDVVEAVLAVMEDDPLFNAGKGSVFTSEGTNEMDAAIMDGESLDCGAVSGVKTVRNPIRLARKVMDESRHVFLSGPGAETFAAEQDLERVDPEYFFVQKRYDQWQKAVRREEEEAAADPKEGKLGTVGAVVLDTHGDLAAGNSTGGMTNKRFGRVGDVPIIGAGTYADNRSAAVACTGVGEQFIRHTVARAVAARVEHGGETLEEAARTLLFDRLEEGDGGLVAVDRRGRLVTMFNSEGMSHGAADSSGRFEVGIWEAGAQADGD